MVAAFTSIDHITERARVSMMGDGAIFGYDISPNEEMVSVFSMSGDQGYLGSSLVLIDPVI